MPFGEITWQNFERLCFRLASLDGDVEYSRLYGTAGQEQGGIDIYARSLFLVFTHGSRRRLFIDHLFFEQVISGSPPLASYFTI